MMMKKNFLHRDAPAYRPKSVETVLFAVCLCLLASSCDKNLILRDGDGTPVALQFSTSVDSRGGSNTIEDGIVYGTDFPQGIHEIGVFMNTLAGGTEASPGTGDNMKATLTYGMENSWAYADKDGNPIASLPSNLGKHLKVIAYYPYNTLATATAVPFDFTATNPLNQKDLLYNKNKELKVTGEGAIPLVFAHAYSLITLKIAKSVNSGTIRLNSVGIINQSGEWIKNKGTIDPATGYPNEGAQVGNIVKNGLTAILDTGGSTELKFLVPAFMSMDVTNGQIAFKVLVDEKESVYQLKRNELNYKNTENPEDPNTLCGFEQGTANTYELVYDNLSLSLKLRAWTSVAPEAEIGLPTVAEAGYRGWIVDYNSILPSFLLDLIFAKKPITDHRNESYLGTIESGNNGSNLVTDNASAIAYAWLGEPPRSPLQFAMKDVISNPVQWKDKDGVLVAKQLCRNYREGGYSNWRLPRLAEWDMLYRRIHQNRAFADFPLDHGGKILGTTPYWCATEAGANISGISYYAHVFTLSLSLTDASFKRSALSPFSNAMVRCVRDAELTDK